MRTFALPFHALSPLIFFGSFLLRCCVDIARLSPPARLYPLLLRWRNL